VTSPPAAEPAATLVERIHRQGPIRFGEFVEVALYGPSGFFTRGGGAGRAGQDFVTSPEVGPLFGACVARAIDREWERLGRPDPFVVVEAGAGITEETVIAGLKDQLARFKQPKHVFVVDALPRNAMGKVQKKALRDRYAELFKAGAKV